MSPVEISREIGNLYGNQFLNPSSTPMFIIDRQGEVHPLPFGIKSAEDLFKTIDRLSVFLWFGLSFGLPLLLLSFLSGGAQRWITRGFARHSRVINRIAGILLMVVAIYDLATNWAFIT